MQSLNARLCQLIPLIIGLLCLVGCYVGSSPHVTSQPTRVTETATSAPAALVIEEYALKDVPQTEPLTFVPVQGSQEEILAKHQQERHKVHLAENILDGTAMLGNQELAATEIFTETVTDGGTFQKVAIQVSQDNRVICTIPAGDASPVPSFRGLWTYDDHWVLEIAHVTQTTANENGVVTITSDAVGQIVQDGELLNERYGYQEMFGFQLMKGRPFYFFKKDRQIGISYDDQQTLLGYEFAHHYGCCSGAELNPISAQNMVAFFAYRDGVWYYVEIGVYE